ncbi:MAG TPA: serine hydrolase, partial [Catenuloplanes sp.]
MPVSRRNVVGLGLAATVAALTGCGTRPGGSWVAPAESAPGGSGSAGPPAATGRPAAGSPTPSA